MRPRRTSRAPGGMPVIAPMPAARPARIPAQAPTGTVTTPVQTGAVSSVVPAPTGAAGAPHATAPLAGAPAPDSATYGPALVTTDETTLAEGTTVDHLTETYRAHYRSLLGLAALLLDDVASCEDVVQEAFIRVHSARGRVREPEKTLAYLRQTVVNLSRSALRRRILGLKLLSKPMPDMASAEEGAYVTLERDALIKAMRGLQRRQREVLSLRYFADMTEAQVAEVLGISLGSVKAYGSRGIAALRVAMEATA
ncbi:SigE family RNA polymerase sigma factor [Streptomyces sp. NPDC091272]|uniref:SigE family RNA polymerase sigma factor n=1 Tax=Streptomyces sp. NPDC091272 TaxID=3365981 RepID=UPI00381756E0